MDNQCWNCGKFRKWDDLLQKRDYETGDVIDVTCRECARKEPHADLCQCKFCKREKTMEIDCSGSSNCSWARYRESERVLEVDFKDKAGVKQSTYEYADVPPELVAQFNAAESKGRFFALHIRNQFKATKTWSR